MDNFEPDVISTCYLKLNKEFSSFALDSAREKFYVSSGPSRPQSSISLTRELGKILRGKILGVCGGALKIQHYSVEA